MPVRARCLLFAVSLLAFPGLASGRPTLDAARLAQLGRYEVLLFADPWREGIDRGKAIGVFEATPEEVFRVATEYAKYQDYLPRVRASRVRSADAAQAIVEMTAELPWPAGRSQVTARYATERLSGEIYRIRFAKVGGQMRQYQGSLYIEPWGATQAAVTYELVAEPDVLAPRSAINRFIKRSASGFVHALRQRVNDLHRMGYLHPLQPAGPPAPTAPSTSKDRAPLAGPPLTPHPPAIKAERR